MSKSLLFRRSLVNRARRARFHLISRIARNFPAAKLLPQDPMKELQAISLLAWCASGIHPFLSRINSPARVCDVPGAEESVRRLAAQQLFENYKIADDTPALWSTNSCG